MNNYLNYLLIVTALLFGCNNPEVAGGGTEDVNSISGVVEDKNGTKIEGAEVALFPIDFNPIIDGSLKEEFKAVTNNVGEFKFANVDPDDYNIKILSSDLNKVALINDVRLQKDESISDLMATVEEAGKISITLNDLNAMENEILFIPGSDLKIEVTATHIEKGIITLPLVPPAEYSEVRIASVSEPAGRNIIDNNIALQPGETLVVGPYFDWVDTAKIVINTSASGANVSEDLINIPILIRLDASQSSNLSQTEKLKVGEIFARSQPNGSDIRFSNSNGLIKLETEIESWDSLKQVADIWVKVDTLYGNNGEQTINLHFNNDQVVSVENNNVFDTSAGFLAVWHLNESGNSDPGGYKDVSDYNFHGTGVSMDMGSDIPAVIGRGAQFDGSNDYIAVPNTANSILNFPVDGFYTLSAWVYLDTLNSTQYPIINKGDLQYALKVSHDINAWNFHEKHAVGYHRTTTPAQANIWVHMVGVSEGPIQRLYINGNLMNDTGEFLGTTNGRNLTYDVNIGRNTSSFTFFKGMLDEIRISTTVRSANWIKYCYENQKMGSSFIKIQ